MKPRQSVLQLTVEAPQAPPAAVPEVCGSGQPMSYWCKALRMQQGQSVTKEGQALLVSKQNPVQEYLSCKACCPPKTRGP